MTRKPLRFAIAMPIGAWHPLLPSALESLAVQTPEVQVAFLDASGDARVAEAADKSGITFHYRREGPDSGQAAAIAEGWDNTDTDILGWLNGDDILCHQALDIVSRTFNAHPDNDVVYGQSDFIDETGHKIGHHDQVDAISDLILRSNIISQPSCFATRQSVDAIGGINSDLKYTMDWDLWVRLYQTGHRFEMIDQTLSNVFMGEGTKTADMNLNRMKEVWHLVKSNKGHLNALKSIMGITIERLKS